MLAECREILSVGYLCYLPRQTRCGNGEQMKRLWMTMLLFCSVSSGAIEKTDFTLKWRPEKHQTTYPAQHQAEGQKKWVQPPSSFSVPEPKSRQPDMFGRVDKAHRLRYSDPNFSSFNSDEGYSDYVKGGNK